MIIIIIRIVNIKVVLVFGGFRKDVFRIFIDVVVVNDMFYMNLF